MSELSRQGHPELATLIAHAYQIVGWLSAGAKRDQDEAEKFRQTIGRAVTALGWSYE